MNNGQNFLINFPGKWLLKWSVFVVMGLALVPGIWSYTQLANINKYRLHPEDVSWVYVLDQQSVRRPYVDEPVYNLNTPWPQKSGMQQQFTYRFHGDGGLPVNYAVFIPHMTETMGLHINGVPIFTPWETTKTANFLTAGKAGFIPVGNHLYHPGINRLVLSPEHSSTHIPFTSIYFGPKKELLRVFSHSQSISSLRVITSYLMILAAFLSLAWGVWSLKLKYVYSGMLMSVLSVKFITALQIIFSFVGDWWLPINQGMTLLALSIAIRFLHKEKRLTMPVYPFNLLLGLLAFFSLLGGFLLSLSLQMAHLLLGLLWPLATLVILAIITRNVWQNFRQGGVVKPMPGSAIVLSFIIFVVLVLGNNPYIPVFATQYMESFFLVTALVFSIFLVTHVLYLAGHQFIEFSMQRMQLSRLISQQKLQLDSQSRKLEQVVKAKAILQERQRLIRDMHDGIGGTLASLIVRVRLGKLSNEETENELQRGLTDLRLIVDSLDHVGQNFEMVLHMFRDRIEPQIQASKMKLKWEYDSQLNALEMDAGRTLHVFRFLQEAVSNAIRHSGAHTIKISCQKKKTGNVINIRVQDDGIGIAMNEGKSTGRGMNSMKLRARRLGGDFTIGRADHTSGTLATLSFPFQNEP
jgi:signal transduction histidine kinase